MLNKFKEITGKAGLVIREYPMVLLMAFLGAVSMICFAHCDFNSHPNYFVFLKFSLVSCLGISLMFAIKMLSQRFGRASLLEIIGIVFLVFFYLLLPEKERDFTEKYAFLLIPTFILSHLLVSFSGFFDIKKELNFWQYNKNLFINLFLTAVFTGVLTGGVELAILAVDQLFDFKFNQKYYAETFYFLSIFGSCFIFLLFSENGLTDLEKESEYPLILKFFTQYILIPLLIIYSIILYFYAAKILIKWELPRGWVSYLVLAYSVVGILALLLVHPLKEKSTKSWVKIFSKIFYYTLIPLIILLFTAIFTRILEYGYTEPRYFVLLLALWLTTVVFYFIFIKKSTIKFVPISLFTFGLFALVFPYFNTFSVSKRSQKSELQNILTQNNLLEKEKIDFNKKISDTVAEEVSNKFEFLAKRGESKFLLNFLDKKQQKIFAKNLNDGKFYQLRTDIQNQFNNIEYTTSKKSTEPTLKNINLIAKDFNADISNYRYLFKAYNYKENHFEFDDNIVELKMPVSMFKSELNLVFNEKKINLVPDLRKLFEKYPDYGEIKVDDLFIIKTIGNYEFKIMFDSIILSKTADTKDQFLINSESVLILIK